MNIPMIRPSLPPHLVMVLLLASCLVWASACGDEQQQPQQVPEYEFPIEVSTLTIDESPVAGVPVRIDGSVVGFTDAEGVFKGTLLERPGEEIELSIDEMEGYYVDSEDTRESTTLKITRSLEGNYRGLPVTLRAELQSTVLEYLTWVQLNCDNNLDDEHCENVPILLDGEEMARTDSTGFAHFVFEGNPGEEHEFRVDMSDSGSVTIEPSSPRYEIELERNGMVFHINEEFTDPTVRTRRRARPRPRPRPQPQPQPQPEPEPEEESSGVIPLF